MEKSGNDNLNIVLFPYKIRYPGVLLVFIGLASGYFYFFGVKPDFFTTRIFAVITSYLETRYFVLAQTNLLDEIAAVGILSGLTLIGFSKEFNEFPELQIFRLKALIYSIYLSVTVWIILFLLIFGWTIFIFSSSIFLIFLISFIALFRIMIFNYNNKKSK